ncbi:hypothetical protein [Mariniblastus fucicola]|uniref:Uncharacterized protein n=1 Tax=Mariniblastus fucicola TaxID=980251 RepID=A0A5B9PFA6_9BACT|nr:hypothetical protein [Mariniblastus fucicola]QEG25098.1 hypothetical protein MFFC18_50210 [Mariniblastus fucicola]
MSDENEIPIDHPLDGLSHEGRTVEAMLESAELPASRVNRDVLMYQAGWQAALAEANCLPKPAAASEPIGVVASRTSLLWPAMTTVFAVASMILGMMLLRNENPALEVALDSALDSPSITTVSEPSIDRTEQPVLAAMQPTEEPTQRLKALKPASLLGLLGFRPKESYHQRIEQYSRESQWHMTPVHFESSDGQRDAVRLKTGSFLNAEELVDDLL